MIVLVNIKINHGCMDKGQRVISELLTSDSFIKEKTGKKDKK